MSYILEALKKAEQQRGLGRVPGLDSTHEPVRRKDRGRWLWVLTAVLALNAAVLLVLFWSDRRPPMHAATVDEVASARQPVAQPPATAPAPLAAAPAALAPESALQPATSPARALEPRQADAVPRRSTGVGGAAQSLPRPPLSDVPEPAAARPVAAPSLPVWPQVPAHLFQQLNGSLHLDVHVYADQPPERFVLINMKKYHEGERLQEGPRLDEITTDGVILSFQGEKFRVHAQH